MGNLAINGGEKLRTKPFTNWPVFDNKEIDGVCDVIKSGKWWRSAYGVGVELKEALVGDDRAQVTIFQEEFAKYHDAKYGMACANGTAALEIALKALEIGPGDEVIVPSYTYVASATCVLQVNAVPIFVDIDSETYNIDPDRVEEAITEKTKAIIVVHFAGQPVDMDRIMQIAKKHNLFVVEDCAHAHGSEWRGRKVGAIGDVGTFSFQASKTMTSGEGGIILTDNKKVADLCESYIWVGREMGRPWYEHHRLGWNYRLTEFQGSILRAQLSRLDDQVTTRMENAEYFTEMIKDIEGISPLKVDKRTTRHGYYLYMFKFDSKVWGISKEVFSDALIAEGIAVFKGYAYPLYKNPMFLNKDFYQKGCPVNCQHYGKQIDYSSFEATNPVSEKACSEEAVWLEQRMFLGDKKDVDDIVEAILKLQRNVSELREY